VENVADNVEEMDNVFRILESSGQKTCKRITFSVPEKKEKMQWVSILQEQVEELSKSLVSSSSSSTLNINLKYFFFFSFLFFFIFLFFLFSFIFYFF
jgi:hypothetical protein